MNKRIVSTWNQNFSFETLGYVVGQHISCHIFHLGSWIFGFLRSSATRYVVLIACFCSGWIELLSLQIHLLSSILTGAARCWVKVPNQNANQQTSNHQRRSRRNSLIHRETCSIPRITRSVDGSFLLSHYFE